MQPRDLAPILEILWMWAAGPLAVLASVVLTVRLGVPQVTRLGDAWRALREGDEGADGDAHPAAATVLAAVATYGAAGAVGAATAVSLGGAGAVAWVWLFTFLFMPMRMAEATLARTAPPGRTGEVSGSLAGRLLDDPLGGLRAAGWALVVLVPLAGFAFFGGTHGEAVADVAERLAPGSAVPIGLIVAGLGLVLAVLPAKRIAPLAGWVALVAFFALLASALVAFLGDPGRGFGGFGRALLEAVQDAPPAAGFSGALAGEIAVAAILHALPPLAGAAGVDGAWHGRAKAETTRRQAGAALLGPLLYGLMTTLVGLSFVATNAFARPVEGSRTARETTFYRADFETVSQRNEETRLLEDAILRPEDGDTGVVEVHAATERGMIRGPFFRDRGEPANLALRILDGRAVGVQRPGRMQALERAPESALDEVTIHGQLLPRGAALLSASMRRGGGDAMGRVALAALLLLAAIGLMAWGGAVTQTLRARLPEGAARAAAALPAIGLGLAAAGVIPAFGAIGAGVAALLSVVTSIALVVRAAEVQARLRAPSAGGAAKEPKATAEAGRRAKRKKRAVS